MYDDFFLMKCLRSPGPIQQTGSNVESNPASMPFNSFDLRRSDNLKDNIDNTEHTLILKEPFNQKYDDFKIKQFKETLQRHRVQFGYLIQNKDWLAHVLIMK